MSHPSQVSDIIAKYKARQSNTLVPSNLPIVTTVVQQRKEEFFQEKQKEKQQTKKTEQDKKPPRRKVFKMQQRQEDEVIDQWQQSTEQIKEKRTSESEPLRFSEFTDSIQVLDDNSQYTEQPLQQEEKKQFLKIQPKLNFAMFKLADKGLSFVEQVLSCTYLPDNIAQVCRRIFLPNSCPQIVQQKQTWELVFFRMLAENTIKHEQADFFYQFITEKIAQYGYHQSFILALIKMPAHNSFIFESAEAYLPLIDRVIARYGRTIEELDQFAQAMLNTLVDSGIRQLQKLFNLVLVSSKHPSLVSNIIANNPVASLIILAQRLSQTTRQASRVQLAACSALLDAGCAESCLQILNRLQSESGQYKQLKQLSLMHIKNNLTEDNSNNSATSGLLSLIGRAFNSESKTKKPQEDPFEEKSDMRYDQKLGRWLINGKVPSDQQQAQQPTKQQTPTPAPPPPKKGLVPKQDAVRKKRGVASRYLFD